MKAGIKRLPDWCYCILPESSEVITIKHGITGYWHYQGGTVLGEDQMNRLVYKK